MLKLLRADFARMWRSKLFWGALAVSVLFGVYACRSKHQSIVAFGSEAMLDVVFFVWFSLVGIILAVIASLFVGAEYSDGTLRNKLVTGSERWALYLSHFLVSAAVGIALTLAYMLTVYAVGMALIGVIQTPWPVLLQWFAVGIMLVVSFCAIFTLVSMLVPNKTVVAIVLILGVIAGLLVGARMTARLYAPEFLTSIETLQDGTTVRNEIPNPAYLPPERQKAYQRALEILPTGQCHLLADMSATHPGRMMLFSGLIITLSNLLGIAAFQRKDLK